MIPKSRQRYDMHEESEFLTEDDQELEFLKGPTSSIDLPERTPRTMRLAFSTNAYLKHPFDEAAARIAAIGYEGLELLADVPHAWPAGLLDGQKRAILGGDGADSGSNSRTSTRS